MSDEIPNTEATGKRMNPIRVLRKEAFDARAKGASAARNNIARDANPYTGGDNVANRYAWFTGYDLP